MEKIKEFREFLNELAREYRYHDDGGTSYRKETAKIALSVAKTVGSKTPFRDLETTINWVVTLHEKIDDERVEDVSKFLYTIAMESEINENFTKEFREYVEKSRGNRPPLTFKNEMIKSLENDPIEKRIKMLGERARLEAKITDTYVVYMDKSGDVVREYPDGTIVKSSEAKD